MQTPDQILRPYKPALVGLETNLVAAVFPLMKIYPAEYCLRCAARDGAVSGNTLVIETSSGTMALGLAIVCNRMGRRLTVVSDYACDAALKTRIEDLGARVEIVSEPAPVGGYQRSRLDRLEQIKGDTPDHWWLRQYDNPGNPSAYAPFAAQLVEELGQIDCLVGTVGSGGSMCGTSTYLRTIFPDLKVVGVDTFKSVLFGQPDGPRALRGLGNSLMPRNLNHTSFDEIHWVSAAEAYTATRILHRSSALFRGGTSGAAWMVARYWAAQHPDSRVVCIFPDDGTRYIHTIYNDSYLVDNNLLLSELPLKPRIVDDPTEAGPSWSAMYWDNRHYSDLTNPPLAVMASL